MNRRGGPFVLYFVVRAEVFQFEGLGKYREQESCWIERRSAVIEFDEHSVARSLCGHDT